MRIEQPEWDAAGELLSIYLKIANQEKARYSGAESVKLWHLAMWPQTS